MRFPQEREQAPKTMSWEEFKTRLKLWVREKRFPEPSELPRSIRLMGKLIDHLETDIQATVADHKERAAFILFDPLRDTILLTSTGTGHKEGFSGRFRIEKRHIIIGAYHTHPPLPFELHLSSTDFMGFLTPPSSNDHRIINLLLTTNSGFLMVVRTPFTPFLDRKTLQRRLQIIYGDIKTKPLDKKTQLFNFTLAVCLELGLALYVSPPDNPSHLRRVDVTRIPDY